MTLNYILENLMVKKEDIQINIQMKNILILCMLIFQEKQMFN